MKIKSFSRQIPESVDGVLLLSRENRLYFTGFASSAGCLLITKNEAVFFTDSRYIEAATNQIKNCDVIESRDFKSQLTDILNKQGIKKIAVESEKLTLAQFEKYKSDFPFAEFSANKEVDKLISSMRAVKTKDELECIKKAQRIAEAAFNHILDFISVGKTERDVALELDFFMLKNGAEALSFETIAVSGSNSSMPHGVPSSKKIQAGDFLTLDFGAVYKGYHSDMTRTVAISKVSDEQKKVYETVLAAQEKCVSGLAASLSCVRADALAREHIAQEGYADFFSHGTGHGVGIETHELPLLSPRSDSTLQVGNVVTVEPGIYLPKKFGVRIEDMIYIGEKGCENLTSSPKELIIL